MKTAFLFAGQGSQCQGMGKDLYENYPLFAKVIDAAKLGFDLKKMMFETEAEELSRTSNTQPCMGAFAAGVLAVLSDKGITPDYVAGLSLGEYSALYSAGVFDTDTFLKLVEFRGKVMEAAAEGIECRMSAVMGMEKEKLSELCEEVRENGEDFYVTVSNYNCTGQYVICGRLAGVCKVEELCKEQGVKRIIPLKVSGPFHTKYMAPAAKELEGYFEGIQFGEMKYPVIFNTSARPLGDGETIQGQLVKQVQSSIYMEDTIQYLEKEGVERIIEIGPGKALSGFVKRTASGMECFSISDVAGLEEVLKLYEA
ncbi:MAG: ACP S-malonyltransferase [Lachnospiraceae bacterium]|nr:ACP S-malonyltransferase [Lachnospiraceae bacterium]